MQLLASGISREQFNRMTCVIFIRKRTLGMFFSKTAVFQSIWCRAVGAADILKPMVFFENQGDFRIFLIEIV